MLNSEHNLDLFEENFNFPVYMQPLMNFDLFKHLRETLLALRSLLVYNIYTLMWHKSQHYVPMYYTPT